MTPLLSTPLLRAQSDRRLTALAAAGHDRAFEEIVERYRRPLQRYLRRLLSEALAEDVLQATFVRAWQALRVGTEVRDLRPWMYRIAHNQALNALRAAGSALPETPGVLAVSTEVEVERREELRETLDGIGALPDRQRAALLAVAVADRPHADVAAELGLSDGALRQLLLRARTALRAAATAITPYPVVTWLASGQDVSAARVAEVAAGAGGTGVAMKAGAALLAAGAVVAGAPALRDEHAAPRAKHAPAAASTNKSAPARAVVVEPEPAATVTTSAKATSSADHGGGGHRHSGSSRHAGSSSGSSRGPSGPGESESGESESSHSGGSSSSGSGESESHKGGSVAPKSGDREERDGDQATTSRDEDDSSGSGGGDEESTLSRHRADSGEETSGSEEPSGSNEVSSSRDGSGGSGSEESGGD
jgi:RNA polymerase sigma factor (sigma-70 family)